eukprot:Sdes_comp15682_c0_seq1m4702
MRRPASENLFWYRIIFFLCFIGNFEETMFWGLTVLPDKEYHQNVEDAFHLSQVSLTHDSPVGTRVSLMVTVDKEKTFTLCTLTAGSVDQVQTNLIFNVGQEVTFSLSGKDGKLDLAGYFMPEEDCYDDEFDDYEDIDEDEEMFDSDEEEEEDEDEDEADSDSMASKKLIALAKKNALKNKRKIHLLDEDEEEQDGESEQDGEEDDDEQDEFEIIDYEDDEEIDSDDVSETESLPEDSEVSTPAKNNKNQIKSKPVETPVKNEKKADQSKSAKNGSELKKQKTAHAPVIGETASVPSTPSTPQPKQQPNQQQNKQANQQN